MSNRLANIDLLRITACLCVLWPHCSISAFHGSVGGTDWICFRMIYAVTFWAVPVFFMISGAMLIDYKGSTLDFARRCVPGLRRKV